MKMLLAFFGLLATLSPAIAANTAAMNISDRSATISSRGVLAIYQIATREPGFRVAVEQAFGTPLTPGDLEVVNQYSLKKGSRYLNSGLDRQRMPVQHPTVAGEDTLFFLVRSRSSGKAVSIKDKCLNVGQVRIEAVPYTKTEHQTVWNINQVDVQISVALSLRQEQNNDQKLTATASTGPISIVFNNTTTSPPLMAGGGNPNQFIFTRDSRGLLGLGYTIGGVSKIYNTNVANATGGTGGAGGSAKVGPITNTNNNANNNTNVNTNGTVVNTGPGSATGSAAGSGAGSAKAGGG